MYGKMYFKMSEGSVILFSAASNFQDQLNYLKCRNKHRYHAIFYPWGKTISPSPKSNTGTTWEKYSLTQIYFGQFPLLWPSDCKNTSYLFRALLGGRKLIKRGVEFITISCLCLALVELFNSLAQLYPVSWLIVAC